MKMKNIVKKLEKMGYEVNYKKYIYWDNIGYVINKDGYITYLVADVYSANRSTTIVEEDSKFTFKYVLECIEDGRFNLGSFDYLNYVPFSDRKVFYECDYSECVNRESY